MRELKLDFISGGKIKGYNEKDLGELFNQIEGFCG